MQPTYFKGKYIYINEYKESNEYSVFLSLGFYCCQIYEKSLLQGRFLYEYDCVTYKNKNKKNETSSLNFTKKIVEGKKGYLLIFVNLYNRFDFEGIILTVYISRDSLLLLQVWGLKLITKTTH